MTPSLYLGQNRISHNGRMKKDLNGLGRLDKTQANQRRPEKVQQGSKSSKKTLKSFKSMQKAKNQRCTQKGPITTHEDQ